MVHYFRTEQKGRHTIQLSDKINVEFVGGEFVTNDDKVAELLNQTNLAKAEKVWETDAPEPEKPKKKFKVVSGARGHDAEN